MKIEDLPEMPKNEPKRLRPLDYDQRYLDAVVSRLQLAKELLLHSPTDAKWLDVDQFRKFFELRSAFIEKLNKEGL